MTKPFTESSPSARAPLPAPAANRRLLAWLLLILVALIWGTSFILIKHSLGVFSPMQVGTGRIFLAFLFFLPYLVILGKKFPRDRWLPLLGSGMLGYLIPAVLFATAGAHLNSSLAGTLNALSPLFTFLIGVILFRGRAKLLQVGGILLGFAGSVFLVFFSATGSFSFNGYAFLIVLATLCYGFNINIVSRYLSDLPALLSTASTFAMVGPIALLGLATTDFPTRVAAPGSTPALLMLLTLGMVGSGFATILFNRIIQLTSGVFASTVTYLIPVVAVLWGLFDGEPLHWPQVAGMGICLLGVYLINKK
ncbi:DMT family transporter [Larkinella punicea]|uniref:DMT family transporter n=1 Tax=Larkinella punicea TaxID=2315727 RepID=A0A368JR18_9BACT|nr:DMT family transporter [Larkinella punicea]RCR69775.1 DMT family transporter [Larkinella punicea]